MNLFECFEVLEDPRYLWGKASQNYTRLIVPQVDLFFL